MLDPRRFIRQETGAANLMIVTYGTGGTIMRASKKFIVPVFGAHDHSCHLILKTVTQVKKQEKTKVGLVLH